MVLSTLALVGIIQLILLLIGGIFFLFLHTRFLKKQIRTLRGDDTNVESSTPPVESAMTESAPEQETSDAAEPSANAETPDRESKFVPLSADSGPTDPEKVTGEISELRKMLDEKLLLTANLRKLIEGLQLDPDSAPEIAEQQTSSLLHLEEYIKLSRKEAAAVEEKITHYREQLAKAKKLLAKYKEQHEEDLRQLEEEHKAASSSNEVPKPE